MYPVFQRYCIAFRRCQSFSMVDGSRGMQSVLITGENIRGQRDAGDMVQFINSSNMRWVVRGTKNMSLVQCIVIVFLLMWRTKTAIFFFMFLLCVVVFLRFFLC